VAIAVVAAMAGSAITVLVMRRLHRRQLRQETPCRAERRQSSELDTSSSCRIEKRRSSNGHSNDRVGERSGGDNLEDVVATAHEHSIDFEKSFDMEQDTMATTQACSDSEVFQRRGDDDQYMQSGSSADIYIRSHREPKDNTYGKAQDDQKMPAQDEQHKAIPARQFFHRASSMSEASSLPSDEYFEKLCADDDHNKSADDEYNRSGNSEYIDRVGSLKTVRKSIMKRRSLLMELQTNVTHQDNYSEDSGESDIGAGAVCIQRKSLSSDDHDLTTFSNSTISRGQSSEYQRRRSSVRRRFSRPRTSLCSSISTLDDEDPVNFAIDQNFILKRRETFNEEDSYISETERQFKGKEGFDSMMELATDFSSSVHLLRRTRAISALAHRLVAARDEAACIEEVTKLMALLFGLNRVSFAMSTGTDHFLLKRIEVKKKNSEATSSAGSLSSSVNLEYLDSDFKRPYEGTAAGIVVKTLREHYTPRTQYSHFATHKVFYRQGLNSVLASPILVNGNQCMGVILLSKKEEDAFPKSDRILISDIGTLLGSNIYAKRLRKASDDANKLSREMLHSFVPSKVLEKIEGFWDSTSEKYKRLKKSAKSTNFNQEDSEFSPESSICNTSTDEEELTRSNSWYVANTDWSEAQIQEHVGRLKKNELEGKLQMLKKLNRGESLGGEDVIITTKGLDLDAELCMTSRALYAETVHNVSIIFTDIVGFSRIAMGVTPIKVMDMLQNLFNRFDELCDVHGVMKLETIGDAYLAATNLLEEDANDINVARKAAVRALAMAKDMIREARKVQIPFSRKAVHVPWASHAFEDVETLEIRVGIHVGDITCGVLGQRLPKFTICGTTVNLAARMEQTSKPSLIRVTEDFHDLIGNEETGWLEKERIAIKNMGSVDTYLLDPNRSLLHDIQI
jgi:class 3 adenylate cyclase